MSRDIFSNSGKLGDVTEAFFMSRSHSTKFAFLASPFFTYFKPIQMLTAEGCEVQLIVRLCGATEPSALREALADPLVTVRYFTSRSFHPKLYILDDEALVGSANLTRAGMRSNREVSVVLKRDRDDSFEQLPPVFELLWDYADALNRELVDEFEKVLRASPNRWDEVEFQKQLEAKVDGCAPPTVRVNSDRVSRKRSFLQRYRRKYNEILIPAFNEVRDTFLADGRRREDLAQGDVQIEITRFLSWIRTTYVHGDQWKEAPLRDADGRRAAAKPFIDAWHASDHVWGRGSGESAEDELAKVDRLRRNFASPASIDALNYDEIFDTLTGLHAFLELLRFTSDGLDGLRPDFGRRNELPKIKSTLTYLLHGKGDIFQRAYDILHDDRYRLERFGESCTMELIGWFDEERPPLNGRTEKVLRFLGHPSA